MTVVEGDIRSPYEYLVLAREAFADHGGATGHYKVITAGEGQAPGTYKVCMSGACMEVVFGDPMGAFPAEQSGVLASERVAPLSVVNDVIHELLTECLPAGYRTRGITHFNDYVQPTDTYTAERQKLMVFDCAIAKAAAQQSATTEGATE